MPRRPLIVVSDVHFTQEAQPGLDAAFARLLARFPGHELVLNGDIFDLSVDPPSQPAAQSIQALVARHPDVRKALNNHLSRGDRVTLIAGNHDAPTMSVAVLEALRTALGVDARVPLNSAAWFIRRGPVHVEHGHFYDPDNAPNHPLSLWSHRTEPLGVALTRRFVARERVLEFAHAHQVTPVKGFAQACKAYGARTPWIVLKYFQTAVGICLEAGRQPGLSEERTLGTRALRDFALATGVTEAQLLRLAGFGPTPTHHRRKEVFLRLYFDRILAALTLAFGAASSAAAGNMPALGAAVAAGLYLKTSLRKGANRYHGLVEARDRAAATTILKETDAEFVILGHTHVPLQEGGYINGGSFRHSGGERRPYVVVDETGSATLRWANGTFIRSRTSPQ